MFERYTERPRRVIFFARREALHFGSRTIESEHLLLGLILEDGDLVGRFLENHPSIESIRKDIEARTAVGEKISTSTDIPLSKECNRILAYTAEEAERLNNRLIGTEHLLLGILREEKCVAAEILHSLGFRLNAIREELARSPISLERRVTSLSHEMESAPKLLTVPNADTAKRIAEAVWVTQFGADIVASQAPIQAELKFNVWIVTGSSSAEAPLFVFIH